ncbi:hypothetical protein NL108_013630 [Boleophthalmus pectinirostris]|uniref:uncharacterized protein LOC110159421 n=1 Tax=Boleophthalmus pectinirostris TaxID=150288 RepID=UPI000A1C3712|nr:uncharacterized protein LOC110159421 [Boleophthalmus pectinirostris]KAJ0063909.1 hypothetical protein NL108_013630 [Boleophthalmus pectinirostris]
MYWNLLYANICLCMLFLGAAAENCFTAVLNRRATLNVVTGESLSLSCVVQHCGEKFKGKWIWKNSTDEPFRSLQSNEYLSLKNEDLSANQTRLSLHLLTVKESNEGFYGCSVEWDSQEMEQGHLMFVNVTVAVPSDRTVLHGILICICTFICVIIIVGLVFRQRSKVVPFCRKFAPLTSPRPTPQHSVEYQAPLQQSTPQPPPRRHAPQKDRVISKKAPQPPQKTEVVYADISQDALLRQQQRVNDSQQSTVYSSVRFT